MFHSQLHILAFASLLQSAFISGFSIPPSFVQSNANGSPTRLRVNSVDSWNEMTLYIAVDPTDISFSGLTDLVGTGNVPLVLGGALVSVLALGLSAVVSSASSGGKGKTETLKEEVEPEPEPIDISIPYDATVILAYKEWRQEEPNLKSKDFAQFKQLYLEKAVAEVTLKQKSRKFEQLLSSS